MMKAILKLILELEMPKSCWVCRFKKNGTGEYGAVVYCDAVEGYIFDRQCNNYIGRAPFCPLKFADKGEET